ncbi:uncharacterized protein LOC116267346 [Nymphaea colorata]|nr:uncharacterized protein LOC116267346 [Nymphaea colorata]
MVAILFDAAAKLITRTCILPRIIERIARMEPVTGEKIHVHYDHNDGLESMRWTAREAYCFMYGRPWDQVVKFYAQLVDGQLCLSSILGVQRPLNGNPNLMPETCENAAMMNMNVKDRTGRWARTTFKIVVSYHGASFDGWQKQPNLNTVQGSIEDALGRFVDEKKAMQLKDKSLPVQGCAVVAGRTDKGVTALQQVCSFYTWRTDVKVEDIEAAVNSMVPGLLRVVSVVKVSRVFHPNFSAKWRRYFYIFPLSHGKYDNDHNNGKVSVLTYLRGARKLQENSILDGGETVGSLAVEDVKAFYCGSKPKVFSISKVNQMLQQLEGKVLSYKMFARDTKASRSTGPPTECFVYHARATEAKLPSHDEAHKEGSNVLCVELVANRFLRKMVRVLVATSLREAAAGAPEDALLKLMNATCRRATAPPAPPQGLCLVDVGYHEEFTKEMALIS